MADIGPKAALHLAAGVYRLQAGSRPSASGVQNAIATTQALLAPVQAGLAVTSTPEDDALPEGLRPVRTDEGLPKLPESRYFMLKARDPRQPAIDLLAMQVQEVFSAGANGDD